MVVQGPLVSIICLCYNHARFVEEALQSVVDQTYSNIQIIVVDDASADDSASVIRKFIERTGRTDIYFLPMPANVGNCKAFNKGLALATGEYIIDFATDDIMVPERVEKQVEFFRRFDHSVGVIFSDAIYVTSDRKFLYNHFEDLMRKKIIKAIPEGDVFKDVLTTYFISSPTMMIRKEVLDALGGYDENLAYEDFDFWVRSSRKYRYNYTIEKLTIVRKTSSSMSAGWYKVGDPQLHSTYLVCRKAQKMVKNQAEQKALIQRVRYELRQATFSENFKEGELFYHLLKELTSLSFEDTFLYILIQIKLPLAFLREVYNKLKFT
ncbi:MAG TPA: glycosyltransferase [Ohtaekwangia sp.]|uniref:glycosyltransferase n=1 Tax=Ohtaekwangia sp. TaxID=2066019 RepID=UPI002F934AB9